MKRILIVNNNLEAGGAERQLFYITRNLIKTSHVEFLVLEKKGEFVKRLEELGVKISIAASKKGWKLSREIRKYALKGNFNIVLAFLPTCNLACELSTLPIKRHKVYAGARNANPDFITNKKYRLYYWAHLLSDGVISNSEKNKEDILQINKLINPEKIHVVRNILPDISIDTTSAAQESDSPIRIAVAANYRPQKNLLSVLQAILSSRESITGKIFIDWYGLPIGTDYEKGRTFIKEHSLESIINLNPPTNDVLSKYAEADVVGLFSLFEGFPNSICEAILMGKMVITTPVSDIPMLLEGTQNILCASADSRDIAESLLMLSTMSKQKIAEVGTANKENYAYMFKEQNIIQQIEQIVKP